MHLSTNTTWTSNFIKCIKQLHRPYEFFFHSCICSHLLFLYRSLSLSLFLSFSVFLSISLAFSVLLSGPLSAPSTSTPLCCSLCPTLPLFLAHLICLICVRCAFVLNKNKCRLQGTDTAIRVHRIYQFVCIIIVAALYRKHFPEKYQ